MIRCPIFLHQDRLLLSAPRTAKAALGERSWPISETESFSGKLYPVNPHRAEVLGLPCYANIGAIPEKIDLAVVVTPASTVPSVIRECVEAGVRSAIVISAGFKERGPEGAKLEQQIQAELRRRNDASGWP